MTPTSRVLGGALASSGADSGAGGFSRSAATFLSSRSFATAASTSSLEASPAFFFSLRSRTTAPCAAAASWAAAIAADRRRRWRSRPRRRRKRKRGASARGEERGGRAARGEGHAARRAGRGGSDEARTGAGRRARRAPPTAPRRSAPHTACRRPMVSPPTAKDMERAKDGSRANVEASATVTTGDIATPPYRFSPPGRKGDVVAAEVRDAGGKKGPIRSTRDFRSTRRSDRAFHRSSRSRESPFETDPALEKRSKKRLGKFLFTDVLSVGQRGVQRGHVGGARIARRALRSRLKSPGSKHRRIRSILARPPPPLAAYRRHLPCEARARGCRFQKMVALGAPTGAGTMTRGSCGAPSSSAGVAGRPRASARASSRVVSLAAPQRAPPSSPVGSSPRARVCVNLGTAPRAATGHFLGPVDDDRPSARAVSTTHRGDALVVRAAADASDGAPESAGALAAVRRFLAPSMACGGSSSPWRSCSTGWRSPTASSTP